MRLPKSTLELIEHTVRDALAGSTTVEVSAPSRHLARKMYDGASPHIERMGGNPLNDRLAWRLPNGSEIRIVC